MKKIEECGTIRYYNENNQSHRTDGPAIECANGDKEWYVNGQCHRTDGPAIECSNGFKAWYVNDKLHRTDGPAVECVNGDKHWYINGKPLAKQEFNSRQHQPTNDFSEGF